MKTLNIFFYHGRYGVLFHYSYPDVRPFNLLAPNVNYIGRTALLTSKVAFYIFIHQI